MNLSLQVSTELAARLRQAAERQGLTVETVILNLLDERLPRVFNAAAALALLEEWETEDEALTEEELAANAELLRSLDESRPHRKLFEDALKDERK